jgi:hypothetical protein
MAGDLPEVVIGREHCQVIGDAKLRQQSIDRSNLYPGASTAISQLGGLNVIVAIRHQQRHYREPIENLCAVPWTRKALQQLL